MALTKISAAMTAPNTGTGALKIPVGTTAQRVTASAGDMRYNSTLAAFEGYTSEWASLGFSDRQKKRPHCCCTQ